MINLGNVVADSTIRIPFNSFNADGASDSVSGLAAGDVKIYKDDDTTARASASGITVDDDFDNNVGMNVAEVDLSDTAVTDYYEVGSTYNVAVDEITIDGETVRFWIGRFVIENASVGSRIKSIQRKDVLMSAGNVDGDTAIAVIDQTKSVIQLRGIRVDSAASSAGLSSCLAVPSFSGNNIRGLREGTSGSCTIGVDVIEYE